MLDWLAHRASGSKDKIALLFDGQEWDYATLNTEVASLACRLSDAGVESGQHIAVLMPNRVEFVYLIHALARIGVVMVPINTRLTAPEIAWQLEHTDCQMLITSEQTQAINGAWRSISIEEIQNTPASNSEDWHSRPLDLNATQGILHTSGTTGKPKGAMLTFANHFWSATASASRLGLDPDDRWLLCMPLYHVGGQAIIFRACLYGIAVVLHNGFDLDAVSYAIDRQTVTIVSLVPTMLHRLLDSRGGGPFPETLRSILLGGAATPRPLLERCIAEKLPIALTYGLTEAGSQVATTTLDQVREKPGCVGKPLMFSSVHIEGENGQKLPPSEIGVIVVDSPTVMEGYYAEDTSTYVRYTPGRLVTSDLGYLDEDGDLWVVQRRSDLIISGGENIYPAEVEDVLLSHPLIDEVCVAGLPDPEWGQSVAALIVVKDDTISEDDILATCRERLAGYKLPRRIIFTKELPRTASGKVIRQAVREILSESAGLQNV